jgi:hypothetical protein
MTPTIPTSEAKQQLIAFLQSQRDSAAIALATNPDDHTAQGAAYSAACWIKWIAVKATRSDVIGYYYEYKRNVSSEVNATAQAIAHAVTSAIDNADSQAIQVDPNQMSLF